MLCGELPGSCSGSNTPLIEILLDNSHPKSIFIAHIDSSYIAGPVYTLFSIAQMEKAYRGHFTKNQIQLQTGSFNASSGGRQLTPGKKYLIFSNSQDGYYYPAFVCDPYSSSLLPRYSPTGEHPNYKLTKQFFSYKEKKHTGKVTFEYGNQIVATGSFKNGQPDGAWKLFSHTPDTTVVIRILNYKNGKKHGLHYELLSKTLRKKSYYKNGVLKKYEYWNLKNGNLKRTRQTKIYKKNGLRTEKHIKNISNGWIEESTTQVVFTPGLDHQTMTYKIGKYIKRDPSTNIILESGKFYQGKRIGEWLITEGEKQKKINFGKPDPEDKKRFSVYYMDGTLLLRGRIKNGLLQGITTQYHAGKKHIELNYKNGQPHGLLRRFDLKSEKLVFTVNYVNGKREGKAKFFYPNNKVHRLTQYKNGQPTGKITTFFSDGQTQSEWEPLDGRRLSSVRFFHENGELQQICFFKYHYLHGPVKMFYKNGNRGRGILYGRFIRRSLCVFYGRSVLR